ncbi:hypothetical protein CEXT_659281 [Caerostris extrusa]|uniref:Uncharacterized protein n=1 Tax=Caerostris extrusa TaxID=172846 RepID=A0AAV4R8Z6_CAEEX|nr:hypothetical protein CEXT_659281 [Caerostris extrusa]
MNRKSTSFPAFRCLSSEHDPESSLRTMAQKWFRGSPTTDFRLIIQVSSVCPRDSKCRYNMFFMHELLWLGIAAPTIAALKR